MVAVEHGVPGGSVQSEERRLAKGTKRLSTADLAIANDGPGEIVAVRRKRRAATNGEETPSQQAQSRNFLAMYFRDMSALGVLKPEEEFLAAKEIEQLEITVWKELLSFAPATDAVLVIVERCLDNSLAEFKTARAAAARARRLRSAASQKKLVLEANKCATQLRALDSDKNYLEAVLGELGRERRNYGRAQPSKLNSNVPGFTDYARRVARASRTASDARNDFVRANLRLVVSIARRFNYGRMALADLIQEGNLGLMKAVERYDYRRGFRFSTYASWWIRHAISRALADKGREVRLPVHMIDAQHRLSKAQRELTAKLGRQPTTEELSEATEIAAEKIERMRTYLFEQSVSLDRPVNDEDGRSFLEFLHDPSTVETSPADTLTLDALTEEVRKLLLHLKPIEADILRQRFGLDDDCEMTLKEIGEKYNLSRERIRQLQEQALSKLRRALRRKDMI